MNFGTEPDGRRRDAVDFVVHGGIGMFAGALIGMFGVAQDAPGTGEFWTAAAIGALIVGVLAGRFGDRFWGALLSLFWWIGI